MEITPHDKPTRYSKEQLYEIIEHYSFMEFDGTTTPDARKQGLPYMMRGFISYFDKDKIGTGETVFEISKRNDKGELITLSDSQFDNIVPSVYHKHYYKNENVKEIELSICPDLFENHEQIFYPIEADKDFGKTYQSYLNEVDVVEVNLWQFLHLEEHLRSFLTDEAVIQDFLIASKKPIYTKDVFNVVIVRSNPYLKYMVSSIYDNLKNSTIEGHIFYYGDNKQLMTRRAWYPPYDELKLKLNESCHDWNYVEYITDNNIDSIKCSNMVFKTKHFAEQYKEKICSFAHQKLLLINTYADIINSIEIDLNSYKSFLQKLSNAKSLEEMDKTKLEFFNTPHYLNVGKK